jgi:RNA-directed DNA polymerase
MNDSRNKVKAMDSITQIKEAETILGNPSAWNEHKCVTFKSRKIKDSLPAELISENLADKQLKVQWNNINWHKIEEHVNRLQVRITKAIIQKQWNLAKRLSYLLTHSFDAKLLAVRNVVQNKGKKTAGIDGELWDAPETKMKAALKLTDKKYKAKPLKRVFIDKVGKAEKRPLGIPTMHDRAMQALYKLALDPYAEITADSRSFGFRKYRSAQHACEQIFKLLSRKISPQWIIEGDIKGCFDNINHEWLLANIPMDKSVLKQFLKAGFVYNQTLFPTNTGTPQGGIISPVLANITLDGMEQLIDAKYHQKEGKYNKRMSSKYQVNFVRYADDFVITGRSKEIAEEIKTDIKKFLESRGLELSSDKTVITHIDDGFDFIGWNFRKYKGKLLIKPSAKSIQNVTRKVGDIVKNGKAWTQDVLIENLNKVIIGWSNYHQGVVSKDIFAKIDSRIWNMLWRWAKRRHHNKSQPWIKNKYWKSAGSRNWVFATGNNRLKRLSATKIIRNLPIELNKNPYLDKEYWIDHKIKEGSRKLTGLYRKVWDNQKGICPICKIIIDINVNPEERPLHHKDGNHSNNKITNLVYEHVHCHRQWHTLNSKTRIVTA